MKLKSLNSKRAMAALTVTAVLGGGGAALAASGANSAGDAERFETDVAERLGVSEAELKSAYKGAMIEFIERARRAGAISAADAEDAEADIRSGDTFSIAPPPLQLHVGIGGPGGSHVPPPFTDVASQYLGISTEGLEERLEAGQTLAAIARDEGKSVEGLREALVADLRGRLRRDVDAGRLDADDAQEMLVAMRSHLGDLLRGRLTVPPPHAVIGGPPPLEGADGIVMPAPAPLGPEGMVLPAPGPSD